MTNKLILILSFLFSVDTCAHHHTGLGASVVLIKKKDDISFHLSLLNTTDIVEKRYGKSSYGVLYRPHSNYKVGLSLEEDWGLINRKVAQVSSSPRFLLSFLPTGKWVLKLGHSIFHNILNGRSGWRIAPEIRLISFKDWSFGYRLEEDRAFNKKGPETLVIRKHYYSVIYHSSLDLFYKLGFYRYNDRITARKDYNIFDIGLIALF